LLGSAQQLSGKVRSAIVKAFIKDMVDRGITIRHQSAHAVGTDQVDREPFKRRHSLRQTTRATEHASTHQSPPLIPNPMDLLFALIALDSVRPFFEKK
jgi:hypothetical protein